MRAAWVVSANASAPPASTGRTVDTLVAAWLATLEEVLGERFGSDVREEWVRLYRALRSDSPGRIEPL
jgi:hypothetical protein